MNDKDTAYVNQGSCKPSAADYAPETVYEAHINAHISIYFMFSYRQNVKRVSIMRSDVPGDWTNYTLSVGKEIHYQVPGGTWILRVHIGCHPDWLFKSSSSGNLCTPTISRAWGEVKHVGKIDDVILEDTKPTTMAQVNEAIRWYKKAKKEVKNKMLQLIDVIFFNRKTKEIDFRKEIVAVDTEEAYMLAAQEYGKYNSKVHMRHANCLFSFVEEDKD